MKRLFLFAGLSSFLLFFAASGQAVAGTVQLCPLLSSGGIVSLSSANTYVLPASPGQCWLSKSVTINGNGATISGIGPIGSTKAGVTIILNSANYSSSGWAAIAAQGGSNVAVQNSSISCPSGTGVDVSTGSTATVQNSSIFSSTYGVQVVSPASASLHGVTITGCPYAVLANGPSASVTIDGNSLLQYQVSQTSGVGIVNGASGVVHDTTIQGFLNGVDVTPTDGSTASGTVDVENCLFDTNGCSSLSARYAHSVHFSNSTVTNAQGDGIYFYHSTGVIDKSQIIGSLNSGVSFEACPDGATIQNSLVRDSAHQGINVVECQVFPCPAPVTPSLNIKVLNNTLVNNQIANILVTQNESSAGTPAALMQGNLLTQAPTVGIYLGIPLAAVLPGPQGVIVDSALVTGSKRGMEIKGTSTPMILLSDITENDTNGILIYENASFASEQSIFWNNGLAAVSSSDASSVFVNGAAGVYARSSAFGPAGKKALYDNNSPASCDVTWNYWDAADGPYVPSWSRPPGTPNGSGAQLESPSVLGTLMYTPYLTDTPVSSSIAKNVAFSSGGGLTWDSQLGLTIGLTANQGITPLSNEILGVLKVNDTGNMALVRPPDYLLQGQLYVVWISVPLRFDSSSGFLQFSLPSQNSPVDLQRRGPDGSWTQVASVWDQSSHTLTYSPTDLHQLNGTFAITETLDAVYVKCDGFCNGNAPCYVSVQDGAGSIATDTIMYATNETFSGNVTYDVPAALNLSGGWDSAYSTDNAYTYIQGSLTITDGELIAGNIVLE